MISRKKCGFCRKPIKEEFNYCPYCGNPLKNIDEFFDELDRIIEKEFEKLEKMFGFAIPKIKIYPKRKNKFEIRPGEKPLERTPEGKVEEPKTEIIDKDGYRIIRIKLPGVKSENNIEIKRLEESIEIRARSKDKTYFKIIPVKPRNISQMSFDNEELTIAVKG